jgi:hypothetical protein
MMPGRLTRLAWMAGVVLVTLACVLPATASAGSSTTVVAGSRFVIPTGLPPSSWLWPDTDGRYVVFRASKTTVGCVDLTTGTAVSLPEMPGTEPVAIADGTVAWVGPTSVEAYTIATHTGVTAYQGTAAVDMAPLLADGVLVYSAAGSSHAYDLTSGSTVDVPHWGTFTGFARGLLVYETENDSQDVTAFRLADQQTIAVTSDDVTQAWPFTDGNVIAWTDMRDGHWDEWAKDMGTGRVFCMSKQADPLGQLFGHDAEDGTFVWGDLRNSRFDVYGYDVSAGCEFRVTSKSDPDATSVRYSHGTVIWTTDAGSSVVICGAHLYRWVATLSGPSSSGSRTVRLSVKSTGAAARVKAMRFSDGAHWTAWTRYARSCAHTLTRGRGTKHVGIQLKDAAGHVSRPAWVTIQLQ